MLRAYQEIVFALVLLFFVGCGRGEKNQTDAANGSTPPPSIPASEYLHYESLAPRHGGSSRMFEPLSPGDTGVHFVNRLVMDHPMRYLYHGGTSCGGVAIGDVDGDGRPDIYLLSGPDSNKLFRQTGDLEFQDVTLQAQVDGGGNWSSGASMVDVDNDGDLDIYVCNYDAPNLLYINQGNGTFVDRAATHGVDIVDASLIAAFCDYDLDGDLDFYLLTNRYYDPEGMPAKASDYTTIKNGRREVRQDKKKHWRIIVAADGRNWSLAPVAPPDRLFRNHGDGSYDEVTDQAGIGGYGDGLSATWWDYDHDGWPDLYVGNDFHAPDHLYRNNRDGTFSDVIKATLPHTSWFSMGVDVGDINNDGLLDLLSADMSSTTHFMQKTTMGAMGRNKRFLEMTRPPQYMRNALYLNTGTPRFMEVAFLTGLADTDWTWSVKLADFDNDGRIDVFFTNGTTRNTTDSDMKIDAKQMAGRNMWEAWKNKPPRRERNLAFRNLGQLRFDNVSDAWGLDHLGVSFGAAYSDLDRDGDLDLVVVNLDEPVHLYRNQSTEGNGLLIRLRGTEGNRFGIGATVKIRCGDNQFIRQLKACSGFMSGDEPLLHFGLGECQMIDELIVQWPSQCVQTYEHLPASGFYTITEHDNSSPAIETGEEPATQFRRTSALADARHHERRFDDFQRQPLLPNKLSQLGPGVAWGDVDGDGDEDMYMSGAAGQPGRLFINHGDGTLTLSNRAARIFRNDQACEDLAPLFVDADVDGDLDLYVVSGGVECDAGSDLLRDRLYLNDGQGGFSKSSGMLPDLRDSGSAVAACDFDRDGDMDLFIGGRVIPGQYPLAPSSRLLRNEGGRFTDATGQVAPQLQTTGLVTAALWSDADGDGWTDLMVAHEWGPIKFFRNHQGRLIDNTREAGLADRLGWWNGIACRDIDNDGDLDYVVTNFGLNTKYNASRDQPAFLYYGDFGRSGRMSVVEAEFEGDKLFPVRGKSCSTNAMPFLADKFRTYRSFALAGLDDIYTRDCLDDALRLEINTLESGVLLGDGHGRFRFEPLPRLAQASPGFGVVVTEVNGDGNADVYLVQNFFGPQLETGRMDGGLSLLLAGNGDGTFTPVWPGRSGMVVPGDAKSLTTTDLNDDGWPDFVVGLNDGPLVTFENKGSKQNRIMAIHLQGKPGNPTAIGARVTVHLEDGSRQTAEVHAGGGYLSQSTPRLVFGLGLSGDAERIEIRWPDGKVSLHAPNSSHRLTVIDWP